MQGIRYNGRKVVEGALKSGQKCTEAVNQTTIQQIAPVSTNTACA
jgi:hypothetical protein